MTEGLPSSEYRSSDAALIELLRVENTLGIGDMASRMGVTATAVRQRLDRLMRGGLIGRTTLAGNVAGEGPDDVQSTGVNDGKRSARLRGRPSHVYSLTEKGQRTGGDNFRDLAIVLWRELRSVREPVVRQGLISRIGSAMASMYRDEVSGDTPRERLESTAKLLQERNISCGVEPAADPTADPTKRGLAVLTSYACPYPELAEQDRGICVAERFMLQNLVGSTVHLADCRLDGAPCCRFTVADPTEAASSTSGTCIKPG
jgi:predicted ArsR family transcriptional regulator